MKKTMISLSLGLLSTTSLLAYEYELKNGWNLIGSTEYLELDVFDKSCVSTIWTYDKEWSYYIPNNYSNTIYSVESGMGFWVKADISEDKTCMINTLNPELNNPIEPVKPSIPINDSMACTIDVADSWNWDYGYDDYYGVTLNLIDYFDNKDEGSGSVAWYDTSKSKPYFRSCRNGKINSYSEACYDTVVWSKSGEKIYEGNADYSSIATAFSNNDINNYNAIAQSLKTSASYTGCK